MHAHRLHAKLINNMYIRLPSVQLFKIESNHPLLPGGGGGKTKKITLHRLRVKSH